MSVSKTGWAALPLVLALAACGGGSSGDGGGSGGGSGGSLSLADRIEPFDPSGTAKAQAAPAAPVRAAAGTQAIRTIILGPLAVAKTLSTVAEPGVPLQIGEARSVQDTATAHATDALLQWLPTARGTQVAALRFAAEGAHGVRLGVLVQALPDGAVLRFYGDAGDDVHEISAAELQAVAARNILGGAEGAVARTYWSPDFGGPQTTLEIEIPATAQPSAVQIAVPRLSHFTLSSADVTDGLKAKASLSGSCNIDVASRPAYNDQSRSVALMRFVREDGKGFLCTGTLLNNAKSDGTPYFLSANHCISSQVVASTLTTDWFARSDNTHFMRLFGGAELLYASATTDVSFLKLNHQPPQGIVYSGSYFGGMPVGTELAGVHHPGGDLQKVSVGTVQGYSVCSGTAGVSCTASDAQGGTFLTLNWQQGTTEGGSSGSSAFITIGQRRYVVGQLLGGGASCDNPGGLDHYGRFDVSYRAAIKNWLNPGT